MPLTIVPNSYARFSYNAYQQNHNRFSIFAGQVYSKRYPGPMMVNSFAPIVEGAHDHRKSADAEVDTISYPITPDDTCECVTFPNTDFELAACNKENLEWGLFQVTFTDGSCYDVIFDEADVFAQCPSASVTEGYSQYLWCSYDLFNEPSPDDATTKMKVAQTGDTKAVSLRKEASTNTKKEGHTHVHLTVHRMLTLALETVLALQAPWV